jgi:homoserine O-succinyltransferase/O-acetyltransferase
MPVFFDSDSMAEGAPGSVEWSTHTREAEGKCLSIGLVNNMADEALKATERQYISLLNAASEGIPVCLSFYTLPGVPRNAAITRHIRNLYSSVEDLVGGQLDGLIVTGREPLAASLREEEYWPSFTRVLQWAQENTHAAIWSCLAAHAAVLQMDGIERIRKPDKLFGVFDCVRESAHPLLAGLPSTLKLPHSRWNDLAEQDLTNCGYSVLTRTGDAGVDTFMKQQQSLFIFFQGHPEYESATLLREYRRDIGRYLTGQSENYPRMPQGYFDAETSAALTRLQMSAVSRRNEESLREISLALEKARIVNGWHVSAVSIYRNWLEHILIQKKDRPRVKGIKLVADLEPV